MAFQKKRWIDRQAEFPTRRKLAATGAEDVFDVSREEGLVLEEGDVFSAATMNDLEERVSSGVKNVQTEIDGHTADNVRHITAAERSKWNSTANTWVATNVVVSSSNQIFTLTIPNFVFTEGCIVTFKAPTPPGGTVYTHAVAGGKIYDIRTLDNQIVPADAWIAGAMVSVVLTSQLFPLGGNAGRQGTAFFKGRGKGQPPSSWEYQTAFTSNGTFTAPASGWYKVYCIGASGAGGAGGGGFGLGIFDIPSGNGGSTGGVAIHQIWLRKGESLPITINNAISSFSNICSATAGASNGGNVGTARGGNLQNLSGFKGSLGGPNGSTSNRWGKDGTDGLNGGSKGGSGGLGSSGVSTWYGGGGGGGGSRLPGSNYCKYISDVYTAQFVAGSGSRYNEIDPINSTPYPTPQVGPNIKLYGGGNGGGGIGGTARTRAGLSSLGSPGAVIIEKGVGR